MAKTAGPANILESVGFRVFVLGLVTILFSINSVFASTNSQDVSALKVMYTSLNSASQLTRWSSSGSDPCGDSWKGIKCSGSSVTEIKISGIGLTGSMGYQLSSLTSVTYFDLSNNNLQGAIPYQLPPNAGHMEVIAIVPNLAGNSFSGSVPYSISQMVGLNYLNLAHNQLNGQLNDIFGQLKKLSSLDVSFNSLSGDLPQSFGSLSSLTTLNLENNGFTGSIRVLTTLPLDNLNIQNNRFSGWIPSELKDIKNLKTNGNLWSSAPTPPSSPSVRKTKRHSSSASYESVHDPKKVMYLVITIGLVAGSLVLIGIMVAMYSRRRSAHYLDEEKITVQMKTLEVSPSIGLRPPPSNDGHKSLTATTYSLAELQMATGSFGRKYLIGQGTLGQVFKAKYDDGKVMAIKKLDVTTFQGDSSKAFMDLVEEICQLHHANIAELVGYCSERDHNILVYQFLSNGSLHKFLHLSDGYSRPLTWNTRVRIAFGTARALDVFSTCHPYKDIKSANILLDNELNPHLSDCGFASFYQNLNENLGSGYIAPERTTLEAYSLKSDVYSFGVVMLELLTGRKPFDSSRPRSEQSLVRWASPQLYDFDALTNMVDPALRGLYPAKSLSRFADVIALCIQPEPEFRPSMSEVVQALLRLVLRSSMNKRAEESDASCRASDADHSDHPYH